MAKLIYTPQPLSLRLKNGYNSICILNYNRNLHLARSYEDSFKYRFDTGEYQLVDFNQFMEICARKLILGDIINDETRAIYKELLTCGHLYQS